MSRGPIFQLVASAHPLSNSCRCRVKCGARMCVSMIRTAVSVSNGAQRALRAWFVNRAIGSFLVCDRQSGSCTISGKVRLGDNPGVIRWRFESKCRVWPLVATARNLSNGRKTPKTFGGLLKFHLGQAFETKQSKASRACGQEVLGLTAGTRLLEARTDSSSINDGAVARGCLRERSCAVSRT